MHSFKSEIKIGAQDYKGGAFVNAIKADLEALIASQRAKLEQQMKEWIEAEEWSKLYNNGHISRLELKIFHSQESRTKNLREKILSRLTIGADKVYSALVKEMEKYPLLARAPLSDIFNGYTGGKYHFGDGK